MEGMDRMIEVAAARSTVPGTAAPMEAFDTSTRASLAQNDGRTGTVILGVRCIGGLQLLLSSITGLSSLGDI